MRLLGFFFACCVAGVLWAGAPGIGPDNNGCEIECDAGHGMAIVTCPVPASCPHVNGEATATVYDYTTKPADGSKPCTYHLLKSVSPCGCVTRCVVCECVPNGKYSGQCQDMICTYRIKANCKK
jgi:hypothetical protein